MHFHPAMSDNEPQNRVFDRSLTEDPMGWLFGQLSDAVRLLGDAGVPDAERHEDAAGQLRDELPLVIGTISTLLTKVRNGELAQQPA